MSIKNSITNEDLNKRFDNSFALVNYAITLAKKMVQQEEHFNTNAANIVLKKIVDRQDSIYMDDSDEDFEEEEELENVES